MPNMEYITLNIPENQTIQQAYDDYINGLYERKAKPWIVFQSNMSVKGILLSKNGNLIKYSWNDVKDDVSRQKILKRKYYESPITLDAQIWQSFICLGQDIWELEETKNTYGIHTIDDQLLDWDSFKLLVLEGCYEETTERIQYMKTHESLENTQESTKEPIECDWFEDSQN